MLLQVALLVFRGCAHIDDKHMVAVGDNFLKLVGPYTERHLLSPAGLPSRLLSAGNHSHHEGQQPQNQ